MRIRGDDEAAVMHALKRKQLLEQANGDKKEFQRLYMRYYRSIKKVTRKPEDKEKQSERWQRYATEKREQLNNNARVRRAENKEKLIAAARSVRLTAIKYKGNMCADCRGIFPEHMYDFHHRDPTQKEFTVSKVRTWSDKLIAELDKCDLLCVSCHRLKHRDTVTTEPDTLHVLDVQTGE